ncbi:MAG: ABC-2 transporter permease [Coriobacteriia bacterium]|nr:ABC-2 transporter permease [Coriobacteriia bacterium]MCL2745611.1 ABC-2 transporter permease [Coriobacteriia bacterium]MCL2871310.1 ABC-2 transporter permease [Coriobacteriia bacterium]
MSKTDRHDIADKDAENARVDQTGDTAISAESQDTDQLDDDDLDDDSATQAALRFEEIKERITTLAASTKKKGGSPLSCALLDFQIIKPYIQTINIVLYGGAAAMLGFTMGNVFFGFLAGFLLGILFLSYPFAVSEKYKTAELYTSLGISPQSIVAGRYLFSLGFALVVALGAFGLASLGAHFSRAIEVVSISTNTAGLALVIIVLFLTVIMIQLAIYFRIDFMRARFVGMMPLAVAAALVGGLAWIASGDGLALGIDRMLDIMTSNLWIVPAVLGAFIITGIASYLLSLTAYKETISRRNK